MRTLHRVIIYALITAAIEVPSIIVLYSLGYPSNASATGSLAFLIAYNLVLWFLWGYAIGGPIPGQGPRDTSFDLVFGVASMFIIVAAIGETLVWLSREIAKKV